MKLFCFECPECDADYLRKKSQASLCPKCKSLMHLTGIFEVLGEPDHFIIVEESDCENI